MLNNFLTKLVLLILPVMVPSGATAQSVALRNNLLYDATLTPNLGAEIRVDSSWTAGIHFGINAWDVDKDKNKKWRHLLIAPSVRKYFGHESKQGRLAPDSFWGIPPLSARQVSYVEGDLIYSHFNVGNTNIPFGLYSAVKDRRLQGDLFALGGKYGYSWIMARNWRIEAEAGIAVGYAWFDEYECMTCGSRLGNGNRIFLLPQLGVNVVFLIN